MTNCLFFGDSLTYGEYDGVSGGYVDILKRYCHDKYNKGFKEVNVFNLGIGGETTEGLVKRIQTEIHARKSLFSTAVFIAYGANDLAIKDGIPMVSFKVFKRNIDTAISISKEVTDNVFLISILPISEAINNKATPNGKLRTNNVIEQYNEELLKISKDHSLSYIDTYSCFHEEKEILLSKDGIHPNNIGYMKIAECIKPVLEIFYD